MQITRTRICTGAADICAAVIAVMPPATVLAWVLPETALFTADCEGGMDSVGRTGSALLTLGAVLPHAVPAHLRAGSSFGTGGGVMVTSGGYDVVGEIEVGGGFNVGGIVGGGTAPAKIERGKMAKFG